MLRGARGHAARSRDWWRARRRFGGSTKRIWQPTFPSDLPPALRQNAAVLTYAAEETTPHKRTWTVHASRPLYDIVPELCARGAVHELATNIIYRALVALDCKCRQESARRKQEFHSDLFTACSNLFEAHYVHNGAENVFGILNEKTLADISPKMNVPRRQLLRQLVLDTIEEWAQLHPGSFSRVDVARLFGVVGPAAFLKLIPRLSLNARALPGESVEVFFYHLVEEARDLFGTIRIALSLLPVQSLDDALGGSTWSLRRILGLIETRASEHALRFFLSHLDPPSLLQEALLALRDRDLETGLARSSWAFSASLRLQADMRSGREILPDMPNMWPMVQPPPPPAEALEPVDDDREFPRGQRLWLTDGEFRPFSIKRRTPFPLAGLAPPSRFRDTPWPQLVFDPEQALGVDRGELPASAAADAYGAMEGQAEEVDALTLWTGAPAQQTPTEPCMGLPSPYATLPLDAVHFVDSAQALSHVLTFLQHLAPAFVGIDLEWSDPHPVSVIQIATPARAFVIDVVNRTPLYMAVLFCLVDWLLKREEIVKLFFGFPHDLVRLNLLFGRYGKTFGGADHIASVIDLYMQRQRHVSVYAPRPEETPSGREGLLGEALEAGDFEAVQRLGDAAAHAQPPREELTQRVFTVGGHHSLAEMTRRYLGEDLKKTYQVSNWNFRPLSVAQVLYAAVDAHVLLRLEAAMRERGIYPQRTWGGVPHSTSARNAARQPSWWVNPGNMSEYHEG